jgi:hypothetical protein
MVDEVVGEGRDQRVEGEWYGWEVDGVGVDVLVLSIRSVGTLGRSYKKGGVSFPMIL